MNSFKMPAQWLDQALIIHVIGVGGTGSILCGALAQLVVAMAALGRDDIEVHIWDGDTVGQTNIGRQAFFPSDLGLNKAIVLANRLNMSFGVNFTAHPVPFKVPYSYGDAGYDASIFIGCVDTRGARAVIAQSIEQIAQYRHRTVGWLDCGNTARAGQVVLGVQDKGKRLLPMVSDLFPEIVDVSLDPVDETPSCSLPASLAKQDLFTNRMIADVAMNLLWQLLRHGEIESHGAFVNLQTMRVNPMLIDPEAWAAFGFSLEEPAATKVAEAKTPSASNGDEDMEVTEEEGA